MADSVAIHPGVTPAGGLVSLAAFGHERDLKGARYRQSYCHYGIGQAGNLKKHAAILSAMTVTETGCG